MIELMVDADLRLLKGEDVPPGMVAPVLRRGI
jgi:hypothetical protein